jgi:hypothetical protein
MTIANANAAPSCTVNVVVWVMKPGPMAEVAIRNIAPIRVERVLEVNLDGDGTVSGSTLLDDGLSGVCAMASPGRLGRCTRSGAGKSLRLGG